MLEWLQNGSNNYYGSTTKTAKQSVFTNIMVGPFFIVFSHSALYQSSCVMMMVTAMHDGARKNYKKWPYPQKHLVMLGSRCKDDAQLSRQAYIMTTTYFICEQCSIPQSNVNDYCLVFGIITHYLCNERHNFCDPFTQFLQ